MPSVTLIPNSYTDTGSYHFTLSTNTSRQISNAYNNADNTSSSARLTLASNRSSARTSEMYLEFDKDALENIPSGATIGTITANVRYYVSNTTYCTAVSLQLYTSTTAKGSAETTRSTSSAKYSITPGTWTRSELNNIRLHISATHNASTSSAYLYLYGADITINYTLPTAYTITASSTASGVTVEPASQSVYQGSSASVTLNKNTHIIVKDNNVDVTSQLVQTAEQGTLEFSPGAVVDQTFATDSTYPATNGCHDTSNNTYARFKLATPTQHVIYSFDTSVIPATATILSVSCNVKAYISSTSTSITTKTAQLYAETTAKGAATTVPTTNSTWAIADTGSWTASEVRNIRLRFDGYYPNSSSYYLYVYGAELTVVYTTGNYVYVYTISNVAGDHTITVVSDGSGPDYTIYVKNNGSWSQVQAVYVKQNGSWVEASDVKAKSGGTWH